MPRVGFEPTIQVFQRAKTFHALDRVAIPVVYYFNEIWNVWAMW
jgi:hypothetical protein